MNIFDVLPEHFFLIFAGNNKSIYADAVKLIYDKTQSDVSFSYARDELVRDLVELLEEYDGSFEEASDTTYDIKDRANVMIRRLKETGWIQEGLNTDYSRIVFFSNIALPFVDAIENIHDNTRHNIHFTEEDSTVDFSYLTPVEATGYAYTIYSLLKHNSSISKSSILLQITENTKKMLHSLKQLNYRIKSYSDSVKVLTSVDEAIKEFFTEYTQEVLQKNYHKIKTLDHISKYRNPIIDSLSTKLRSQSYLREVSSEMLDNDYAETFQEAYDKTKEMIRYVIDTIQNIDEIISQIEQENYMYTNIILKKTKFMLDNKDDIEGNLKQVLKLMAESSLDEFNEDIQDMFGIYSAGYIDNDSLYTPRKITRPFKQERLQVQEFDFKENTDLIERIRHSQHSQKSIQVYVDNLLGEKKELTLDEIPLTKISDFIYLVYIVIYANRSDNYTIEYGEDDVVVHGVRFKNLVVRGT